MTSTVASFKDERTTRPPSSSNNTPSHFLRTAGIFRYHRESDKPTIRPESPPPEPQVQCEYCGRENRPSLEMPCQQEHEDAPGFCCAQQQHLRQTLKMYRDLLEMGLEMGYGSVRKREKADMKVNPRSLKKTFARKVFTFQLSCSVVKHCNDASFLRTYEVPIYDHRPVQFGICHHQYGGGVRQKYYSDGKKFLTRFSDGSAQLFYPSGMLALIIIVTKENGRVCIVYDESSGPHQPIRAMFKSDGMATCYHSNGNVWLNIHRLGGQCLDETGTRTRRWSWNSPSPPSTPLLPIFLSLNKIVGVRVLGRQQVFVSFLAEGQQAKVSVGCVAQDQGPACGSISRPLVSKEELCVLAARIKIHQIIQQCHQSHIVHFYPQLHKNRITPRFQIFAKRLLEVSAAVTMSQCEQAFIHQCLIDY